MYTESETVLKFLDFFAGIGGFRVGMEQGGHECVGFCEFDKYAVTSYTSMYLLTDKQREYLGTLTLKNSQKEILDEKYRNGEWFSNDIRSVAGYDVPDADCWCFGAPCQSFSVAGKRKGLEGESGLIREIFRILGEISEESRPEWLVYENVKGMLSSNRGFDYLAIQLEMDRLGYDVQWQLFDSKDWGVPQHRERVYTVGHLRAKGSAKIFPLAPKYRENNIPIMQIGRFDTESRKNTNRWRTYDASGAAPTLGTMGGGNIEPCVAQVINMVGTLNKERHSQMNVIGADGILPTLNTMHEPQKIGVPLFIPPENLDTKPGFNQKSVVHSPAAISRTLIGSNQGSGSGNEPKVAVPIGFIDDQGRIAKKCSVADTAPTLQAQAHGNDPKVVIPVLTPDRVNKRQNGRRFKESGEEAFTLTAQDRHGVGIGLALEPCQDAWIADGEENKEHPGIYAKLLDGVVVYAIWYEKYGCYITIRKLTPKECFRLQGFSDELFEKAKFVNSDSQLYKQAGNSVTVNVVYAIAQALAEYEAL